MEAAKFEPDESMKFNLLFLRRFRRILGILFPRLASVAYLLFATLLIIGLLEQVVIYNVGLLASHFYEVLGKKNRAEFNKLVLFALALIVSNSVIKSTSKYAYSVLYVTWRGELTGYLHVRYFRDILYYKINVLQTAVDNVDQRITQDVDKLCNQFSQVLVKLVVSPFTIGYYIYQCYITSGYIGPVSVAVFFVVATVINKFAMSPVVRLVVFRERCEGDLRFKHMQIRSHSESAAFLKSGPTEKWKTDKKLERLLKVQQKLMMKEFVLNFFINLFDYLGSILSYVVIAIPIFLGVYDDLGRTDLSSLISKNGFVSIYLISCFTQLIDLSSQMTEVAGTAHRIGQLIEALEELEHNDCFKQILPYCGDESSMSGSDGRIESGKVAYKLNDISIVLPNQESPLVHDLNLQLASGANVLITGESGCGKSSILRVINGLWPISSGSIECGVSLSPSGVMFLPQKAYFTDGSLRDQIIYPLTQISPSNELADDEQIMELLDSTELMPLLERVGSLDSEMDWSWYDVMSPGEMQRLSFVRLLFHKPLFAVLDEATSQIGLDMEGKLYRQCRAQNITVLSVGHRESLRQYHEIEIIISKHGAWRKSSL